MSITSSAVASALGITTQFQDLRGGKVLFLSQRIVILGSPLPGFTTDFTKTQITSAFQAAQLYGTNSQIHIAATMLFPLNGDGVGTVPVTVYPVEATDVLTHKPTGDILVAGDQDATETYKFVTNNFEGDEFSIPSGTLALDVAILLHQQLVAASAANKILITSSDAEPTVTPTFTIEDIWSGETAAKQLNLELVGTASGAVVTITQPFSLGPNPDGDVTPALAQVGGIWESLIVNCFDRTESENMDVIQSFGEGRWGPLVRRPLTSWTGDNTASAVTQSATSDDRMSDRVSGNFPDPGSNEVGCKIAARSVARMAVIADNNPPQDYRGATASGLVTGDDDVQWTYVERDVAVKSGQSTILKVDDTVRMEDTVTYYHPSGDPLPAYRYAVDIVKLQNIIFNMNLIFEEQQWKGAPLIPDDQATVNKTAKKPKDAKAAISRMIDQLALQAIISDPEFAKSTIVAVINSMNPNRLDITFSVLLSGNINITNIDFNFGFFFGSAPLV